MGAPKLLLPWGRSSLLEHVLGAWTNSGIDRLVIVLPPDQPELARRACQFAIEVVAPPVRPVDMKQSVSLGLARLTERFQPSADDAWLLAPADLPGITPEVIRVVMDCYDEKPGRIVTPVCRGKRAHPIALPWSTTLRLDMLGADQGINAIVKAGPVSELNIDLADLLDDLDTPGDYARLHNRYIARKPT
jgi:molybdenum cofactor cytidylyltransferase